MIIYIILIKDDDGKGKQQHQQHNIYQQCATLRICNKILCFPVEAAGKYKLHFYFMCVFVWMCLFACLKGIFAFFNTYLWWVKLKINTPRAWVSHRNDNHYLYIPKILYNTLYIYIYYCFCLLLFPNLNFTRKTKIKNIINTLGIRPKKTLWN